MKRGFTSPRGRWRRFSGDRRPSHLHLHHAGPGGVVVHHHRGAMCRSAPCHAHCPRGRVRRDRSSRLRGCAGDGRPHPLPAMAGCRIHLARRCEPAGGSRLRRAVTERRIHLARCLGSGAGRRPHPVQLHATAEPRIHRARCRDPGAGSRLRPVQRHATAEPRIHRARCRRPGAGSRLRPVQRHATAEPRIHRARCRRPGAGSRLRPVQRHATAEPRIHRARCRHPGAGSRLRPVQLHATAEPRIHRARCRDPGAGSRRRPVQLRVTAEPRIHLARCHGPAGGSSRRLLRVPVVTGRRMNDARRHGHEAGSHPPPLRVRATRGSESTSLGITAPRPEAGLARSSSARWPIADSARRGVTALRARASLPRSPRGAGARSPRVGVTASRAGATFTGVPGRPTSASASSEVAAPRTEPTRIVGIARLPSATSLCTTLGGPVAVAGPEATLPRSRPARGTLAAAEGPWRTLAGVRRLPGIQRRLVVVGRPAVPPRGQERRRLGDRSPPAIASTRCTSSAVSGRSSPGWSPATETPACPGRNRRTTGCPTEAHSRLTRCGRPSPT